VVKPNAARFLRVDVIGEAGIKEVDVGTCFVAASENPALITVTVSLPCTREQFEPMKQSRADLNVPSLPLDHQIFPNANQKHPFNIQLPAHVF